MAVGLNEYKLMIQSYGEVAIAISRRFMHGKMTFKDEEEEDSGD